MLVLDTEPAPLQIPLEDVLIATNNFSEENLLKRGEIWDVYKGVLPLWSKVAIHDVIIRKYRSRAFELYNEIERLSHIKHRNMVSVIGFCDERDERMIVMENAVNGSLDKHLSDPETLTWSRRLHVCFSAALALEFWKYNATISFCIKGFKILLDNDWEAKVLICNASSWCDTKNSDTYCLGVILLEVLYGRKAMIKDVNQFLAKFAKDHHEGRKHELDDSIAPNLRKQMLPESLCIFLETTYDCLIERPKHCPPMYQTVKRLKEAFEIQWKHENLLLVEKFAHLKIPLSHIKMATNDFADTCSLKSHRYEMVYKAELNHFDRESLLRIEGENNSEIPKKEVIIKRIFNYKKITKDFFVEIEMLSSCKHPNLLTLLGFCDEDSEMILVFECNYKETLSDYLRSTSNRTSLSWEQRIRICLDITHGLKYLHSMEDKHSMIHHGMLSANVFLNDKGTAKIADFKVLKINSYTKYLGQSSKRVVVDDTYFLGITLMEILTGRLASDPISTKQKFNGFASKARRCFKKGKLKKIVDPRIMEETHECSYSLKEGPNQDSLDTFSEIAYQCLVETPSERPTLEVVIKSLEKALHFQVQENLTIPLEVILLATENFDEKYRIGIGGYATVYKAELNNYNIKSYMAIKRKSKDEPGETPNTIAIKRIKNREDNQGKDGFFAELDVLSTCDHPNIISLLGCCVEGSEMLLVYEHAYNGCLEDYLGSTDKTVNLTWVQRLKMCIDIASGLNYLHTNIEDKRRIIHRDIKSANILLGKNWEAKIADFGLSKVHLMNQVGSTINTKTLAGTDFYLDPEYVRTGKLKKASDIYSLGVVLFEIFSGKLAYDPTYILEDEKGLTPIAQKHFQNGTLNEILDPKIRDEPHQLIPTLKVGPDHESLNTFSKIAYQCLARTQAERPTVEEVLKELKEALNFQENRKDAFKFSLEDIKAGVGNFSDENRITRGDRMLYVGEVQHNNTHKKVVVKRFQKSGQEDGFLREFEVLFKHKQENIIGLVGYCKELDEKVIVYENASNGCLSGYLNDTSFSWSRRLKVCIDIANGLHFLHGVDSGKDVVIHRDINSSNILLTETWKAKICGFDHSLIYPQNQEIDHSINNYVASPGHCDPLYRKTSTFTKESDIYSLGVILFEILCGRSVLKEFTDHHQCLDILIAQVDDIVFEGIKEQIVRESLVTFQSIAFQCLHENREERPTAGEVVVQLQKALEFQEAYEIWEAKLPRNYKKVLQYTKFHEIYSTMAKKDIHDILSKGIILQDDKRWFSIDDNGERNEMISARLFSFRNRWSHKWRSIQESRFPKVAEMLDISNLNIQIKIRPHLLSAYVKYSVHLVFKFCGPRKSCRKRMYVNLKYKMGNENLHAYFATRREDDWMMIELCRFPSHKKDIEFEVLLEGFSRCYCDNCAIYIEGIEFRAIDNQVKHEIMENLEIKQADKSPCEIKIKKDRILWHPLSKMKRKVYHMESAKAVVYDFSNVTLLHSKSSIQSRVEWIYKVPRQSVFCIKWYHQRMSPNTECLCYLVFKLSRNCDGLHCPVIVRDLFHWKSKEIIYFRPPKPWNLHDTDRVPKKRRDGWMEVIVSKCNSDFVLKKDCLMGKLKFVCYEGTMFGLIIRGLEFRPLEE